MGVGRVGYCRATFVADGGRKSEAVCGHFPDQILIDPTARNKALLKHNPLSGISTADPVSEPRRPDLATPTNGFYDIKPTDQISPRPILGDFDADLKDPFSGSLTIPNSTLLKSYLDEVITG